MTEEQPAAQDKQPDVLDGRYEGGDSRLSVVLRVDVRNSGVISADVSRVRTSDQVYAASVRTRPGTQVTAATGSWPAVWQLNPAVKTTGSIAITPTGDMPDTLTVTLRLDEPLNRLPAHTDLVVNVTRAGDALRSLDVEIELEDGVRLPEPVIFQQTERTLFECFTRSGFAVQEVGTRTVIPQGLAGIWNDSAIYSALHAIMVTTGRPLNEPAWELHLLMLSKSLEPRLAGVMFDFQDSLPRQGAAVFAGVHAADDHRKLLKTMVHELGHALNLAHRFEREVGRADSPSFMNYDWKYAGPGTYFDAFTFSFDPDELAFLRHGPRGAVIPGGEAFHSVRYWADGTGGHAANPEEPIEGVRLTLTPPEDGPVFTFGQPVFLKASLANLGPDPLTDLEPELLDPKARILQIMVQRRGGAVAGPSQPIPFAPGVQRCMAVMEPDDSVTLQPGGELTNNVQLTFGSGGFTFAEPGEYDVTPIMVLTRRDASGALKDHVVKGAPLRIRIAHPRNQGEEQDALTLLRPDVGAWFALGGSDALSSAGEALEEVRERRTAAFGAHDPAVAAIVRAAGINAGRPSIRYEADRLVTRDGDPERAALLLGSLDAPALRAFDPHTAAQTTALAATYAAEAGLA